MKHSIFHGTFVRANNYIKFRQIFSFWKRSLWLLVWHIYPYVYMPLPIRCLFVIMSNFHHRLNFESVKSFHLLLLSQHLVNDIYITKYQKFWTITGTMDYRAMIVNTTSFGISIIIDYHYYYYKLQQSHKSNIQIRVFEQSWINLKSISVKMGKKIDNSAGFGWLTNWHLATVVVLVK